MLHLAWPWALLALPLPLLWRWLLPPTEPPGGVLRVPDIQDFGHPGGSKPLRGERPLRLLLASLVWLLLVLAAARPQWLGEPIELPLSGRDLLLAVDLSRSMEIDDFELAGDRVDRLTAIKRVAGEFIQRRVGDRIGLILFGEQAYLQAPLTFDRATVRRFLDEAVIGLAGERTAIGDAIGLGVKMLARRPAENRVLILLTDGANTAGEMPPVEASQLAAKAGVTIYTIGVGASEMLLPGLFGSRRVNPSRDLDENTLKTIARETGGRYFRARDTAELERIYQALDELEPVKDEQQWFRPMHSLYTWPLGLALLLAFYLALPPAWRVRGS